MQIDYCYPIDGEIVWKNWTDHLQMTIELMPLFWKWTRTWKGTQKGVDETTRRLDSALTFVNLTIKEVQIVYM